MEQHLTKHEFHSLIKLFSKLTGIKYSEEKLYLFESRLLRFVGDYREFHSYHDFINKLKHNKRLQTDLINALTTNYTYFFRESKHFRFLQYILKNKFTEEKELRLWSAAASGGHEAYSMAISLLGRHGNPHKEFKILGTDIASDKINFAKKGVYKEQEIKNHIFEKSINKFFLIKPEGYEVKQFVKEHVTFATMNIMNPLPFKKNFHIIFLRNILIYFKPHEKELILKKIANYIHPKGYLIISLSESLTGLDIPFKHISSGIHILKRK